MKKLISLFTGALIAFAFAGAGSANSVGPYELECDGEEYFCLGGELFEVSLKCEDDAGGFTVVQPAILFDARGFMLAGSESVGLGCGVLFGTSAEKLETKCVFPDGEVELEVKFKGECDGDL